jgi:hypothetical protein
MKKFIISIVASLAIFNTSISQAADNTEAIAPLHTGQLAPFEGLLLTPSAVAKIIAERDEVPERVKIEVDKSTSDQKAKDDAALRSCQISADSAAKSAEISLKAKNDDLNTATKKLAEIENKSSNGIWYFAGGAVSGIILTTLTVFLISHASK